MQYQKEDVRNRIVSAAKTEFLRVGYYRASMLQISTKAHVPIGNLYRYFASKSALFDAIVGTTKERILSGIKNLDLLGVNEELFHKGNKLTLADDVSFTLADISRNYHQELVLLLEKSGGSEYENFISTCIEAVKVLLIEKLIKEKFDNNTFVFDIIADNLTRGIFRIMIECPIAEQKNEIARLLIFYFNHIEDRI